MSKQLLLFSIIVSIVLTFSVGSYGEEFCALQSDFEFRNGIHFEDTIDEVLAKETVELLKMYIDDHETQTLISHLKGETFSGIENTVLAYNFGSDKKLCAIEYLYNREDKEGNNIPIDYRKISEGLKRKYGDAVEKPTWYHPDDKLIESLVMMFKHIHVQDNEQWQIHCSAGTVVIDHFTCSLGNDSKATKHLLIYSLIPILDTLNQKIVDSDL